MYIVVYSFVLAFFAGQTLSSRPFIEFYKHKNKRGSVERISYDYTIDDSFGACHRLNVLNNEVSSLNTNGNCIALYSNSDCTGDRLFMAVGSPSHNNLAAIDFNDRASSFSSCDLDESITCRICPRSLIQGQPEYNFWRHILSITSRRRLEDFLRETENGERFISWRFLIPDRGHPLGPGNYHRGDEYEYALIAHTLLIENEQIRHLDDLMTLHRYANQVVNDREYRLEPENWRSHSYVTHRAVLDRWRDLSDILNRTIDEFHDELRKRKRSARTITTGASFRSV